MFCSQWVLAKDHGANREDAKYKGKGKGKGKDKEPVGQNKVQPTPVDEAGGVDGAHPPGHDDDDSHDAHDAHNDAHPPGHDDEDAHDAHEDDDDAHDAHDDDDDAHPPGRKTKEERVVGDVDDNTPHLSKYHQHRRLPSSIITVQTLTLCKKPSPR